MRKMNGQGYHGQVLYKLPMLGYRDVWWFAGKIIVHYSRGMSLAGYVQQLFILFMVSTAGLAMLGIAVKTSVSIGVLIGLIFASAYIILGLKSQQLSVVMNHIVSTELTPYFTALESAVVHIAQQQAKLKNLVLAQAEIQRMEKK